jgi:invasion protein IalB
MDVLARRLAIAASILLVSAPGAVAGEMEPVQMAQAPKVAPRGPAAPGGPSTPNQPSAPGGGAQPAQVPVRTEIQYFENWIVTCNEFAEGPRVRVCSALLQVVQQESNQRVFAWSVTVDNNKQLVTEFQTPTGVAIAPGVELRIGKSAARKVPFTACDTGGCLASVPMDAALVREMTASPTAEAVIQGRQGNTVQFNMQMKGFDKAYAVLSRS